MKRIHWTPKQRKAFCLALIEVRKAKAMSQIDACSVVMATLPKNIQRPVNSVMASELWSAAQAMASAKPEVKSPKMPSPASLANLDKSRGRTETSLANLAKGREALAAKYAAMRAAKTSAGQSKAPIETELGLRARVVKEPAPAPTTAPTTAPVLALVPTSTQVAPKPTTPSLEQSLRDFISQEVKSMSMPEKDSLANAIKLTQIDRKEQEKFFLAAMGVQSRQVHEQLAVVQLHLAELRKENMVLLKTMEAILKEWGVKQEEPAAPSAATSGEVAKQEPSKNPIIVPEIKAATGTPVNQGAVAVTTKHNPEPAPGLNGHVKPAKKRVMFYTKDHRYNETNLRAQLPGLEVVLRKSVSQAESGDYDMVVFDCSKNPHKDQDALKSRFGPAFKRASTMKSGIEDVKNTFLIA